MLFYKFRSVFCGYELDVRVVCFVVFFEGGILIVLWDRIVCFWVFSEGNFGFEEGYVFIGYNNFIFVVCIIFLIDKYLYGMFYMFLNKCKLIFFNFD